MVVGPPGTGKTDVAVQIISNLYHNFPEQRTLLVTHSNQALNQVGVVRGLLVQRSNGPSNLVRNAEDFWAERARA